jgi:alpha-tubulin suppressor-like RCC1 family protein
MAAKLLRLGGALTLLVALTGCNTLFGWGALGPGAPVVTAPADIGSSRPWVAVDAGNHGSCAITSSNRLFCDWAGTSQELRLPGVDPATWASASITRDHLCATTTTGALWCLGDNSSGQLGIGSTPSFTTSLVRVGTADDWRSVSVGVDSTCGIRGAGDLWCWGRGIGDGTTAVRATPTRVGVGSTWAAASVGASHACAIRTSGQLWCWGSGGLVGDGTAGASLAPKRIGTASDWTEVAVGAVHACGLRGTGGLWCWGANGDGQLGDGYREPRLAPHQVGTRGDWTTVSVGGASFVGGSGGGDERSSAHTCGIRAAGELFCWGANAWGELGDGTTTDRTTPTRVGPHDDWIHVSVGGGLTRGIRADA